MSKKQKVVLITGGSSGIGLATAKHLHSSGYTVYATSRLKQKPNPKHEFHYLEMDVTNEDSVKNAIEEIIRLEGRIDVLVNNAGIGMSGPIETTPIADARMVYETNILGVLSVCRVVLPHMRAQSSGNIINITSIGGFVALPYRGHYCSSKFAVEAITESLSMEVKKFGIKVSLIEPGDFKTNINENKIINQDAFQSDYAEEFKAISDQVNLAVENGRDPILIAKKIRFIIDSSRPRIRYKVATPTQRLSVFLKRILPGRWFERLIMNHYKM